MPDTDQHADDDDLMRRFADGAADAFDVLYHRYARPVYNVALMILRDPSLAEDVLQETFLRLIRGAATYEPQGHFRAWLMTICRNLCLNRIAGRKARQELAESSGFRLVEGRCHGLTPREEVCLRDDVARLCQALDALPENQRIAVLMFALDGMRYGDIAAVLDCPVNTVKTWIHRGRSTLANSLVEPAPGGP